jgi:hypothetical protein
MRRSTSPRLRPPPNRGDSRLPTTAARATALTDLLRPLRTAAALTLALGLIWTVWAIQAVAQTETPAQAQTGALAPAPPQAAAPDGARDVTVGAFVTSLSDVNADDGTFRVAFYVWFNDPAGRFDLNRDVYFIARQAAISELETEDAPGGGTYTFARIEAYVDQEFDFRDFPFDRQKLTLRIEAADRTQNLRFVPDVEDTRASDYLRLLGWEVGQVTLDTTEHRYETDFGYWTGGDDLFSQILLNVEVARERSPVLIDDFLGFTFAFLITGLTFVVSCTELGLRVGMTTGSLFASVVNLNRLDDAVGFKPDFGLVDRLAFLIFGAIVTSLLISLSTHRLAKRIEPERANKIDTALGAANVTIFFVLIVLTVRAAMT